MHHKTKLKTVNLWISAIRRHIKILWVAFDLAFVRERVWGFIQYQLSCVIIPLLAIATFFFYRLGNPSLPFLPTDASVSWWILFAIRSYLTLQLAYVTEYLFVDVLAMRSPISVQMIGPLATLYTINAKGWVSNAKCFIQLYELQIQIPTHFFPPSTNHSLSFLPSGVFGISCWYMETISFTNIGYGLQILKC